jgi:hypothetical protein
MMSLTLHGLQNGPGQGPQFLRSNKWLKIDPTPVRPDNKENIDTILDARTKLPMKNDTTPV